MKRFFTRTAQIGLDIAVMASAFVLAYLLRFNGELSQQSVKHLFFQLPYVMLLQMIFFLALGIYSFIWRFVGVRELKRFLIAAAGQAAVLLTLRLLNIHTYLSIPISIIIIDAALLFLGSAGLRFGRRIMMEQQQRRSLNPYRKEEKVLLIGAGQAGLLAAKEIISGHAMPYEIVGFIDDDPMKQGGSIFGVKVLGGSGDIGDIAQRYGASLAIITIANATGSQIRRIKERCEVAGLRTRIIPPLYELIGGRINFSKLRDVTIEDLLGREAVDLDRERIAAFIKGKRVLVTGAGGSIGSELVRQIYQFEPSSILLAEQAEFALFNIHRELARLPNAAVQVVPLIVDVCDSRRVDNVFEMYRPQIVFHAAAHKHVPMMEYNPGEAVKNNIFGTKKVADAADKYGAELMLFISTDKAVNPTSVMGASKRGAEICIQALSQRSSTKYMAVRFGNVLGSAGSVIPIFREQLAHGGPLTVTHPEMTRYFMTIPEACLLVMMAATIGKGGEIFVLDMGEPVKIVDLASELIRLSGLKPYEDIDIVFTGMRPGEKLFEELNTRSEMMARTLHNKIFISKFAAYDWEYVQRHLRGLESITAPDPRDEVISRLKAMIPEFSPDEDRVGEPPATRACADSAAIKSSIVVPANNQEG